MAVVRLSNKVYENDNISDNEDRVTILVRGRYKARALVELALNRDEELTLLKGIAKK